jgi:Flp pilus assembly protein TadG
MNGRIVVASQRKPFNDRPWAPQPWRRSLRSERGVSLIQVAIAIAVLTGFSAFVVDHGVMLFARGQAQNVADAAALAGVTARVKDEPGDANPAANGMTEKNILNSISQHAIFGGTSGNIGKTWSWTCPAGVTGWCVTVNVFRDGTNSSTTLPVFFGPLLGATSQKVRATATAVAKSANGTRCLKPFLIPDKWIDNGGNPFMFNPDDGDVYRPWTDANPTGYSTADFNVTQVVLKPGTPANTISPGDFYEIGDANIYEESIVGCEITAQVGQTLELFPGNTVGPTNQGIDELIADGPVDVVIGMFDPASFETQRRQSGRFFLTIVNMLSVRISRRNGNQIQGLIVGGVGEDLGPGPIPTGTSSLIKAIQLVR